MKYPLANRILKTLESLQNSFTLSLKTLNERFYCNFWKRYQEYKGTRLFVLNNEATFLANSLASKQYHMHNVQ